jgi:hypothetical protein
MLPRVHEAVTTQPPAIANRIGFDALRSECLRARDGEA